MNSIPQLQSPTPKRAYRSFCKFGYAYPQVTTFPQIDDAKKEVALNINVTPGPRIYVRNIGVQGNLVTKDEVVRREMRQMEGNLVVQ